MFGKENRKKEHAKKKGGKKEHAKKDSEKKEHTKKIPSNLKINGTNKFLSFGKLSLNGGI